MLTICAVHLPVFSIRAIAALRVRPRLLNPCTLSLCFRPNRLRRWLGSGFCTTLTYGAGCRLPGGRGCRVPGYRMTRGLAGHGAQKVESQWLSYRVVVGVWNKDTRDTSNTNRVSFVWQSCVTARDSTSLMTVTHAYGRRVFVLVLNVPRVLRLLHYNYCVPVIHRPMPSVRFCPVCEKDVIVKSDRGFQQHKGICRKNVKSKKKNEVDGARRKRGRREKGSRSLSPDIVSTERLI